MLRPELLHELLGEGLCPDSHCVNEGNHKALESDDSHGKEDIGEKLWVVIRKHVRVEGGRSLGLFIRISCIVHIYLFS